MVDEPQTETPETELVEGLSPEEVAAHEKLAALAAHPHTQLTKIAADLRASGPLDVSARIGQVQQCLARLIQVVLAHTPPPEASNGEG